MSKIILTRGLPASGKSTWAKAWVAADPGNRVRVSRDDIRTMLGYPGLGTHEQELDVTSYEDALAKAALKRGRDVVVDAMHLSSRYQKRWYAFGVPVEVKDFVAPVDVVIERDAHRSPSLGAAVILGIAQRYHIKPDGNLPAPYVPEVGAHEFKPYVPGTVVAYSFDIDGTLLHMGGRRGPYDTSLYHLDVADTNVVRMLWHLQDYAQTVPEVEIAFIGLSGRNADFRRETQNSLRGWGIELDELFMRPSDQPTTNDAIVKSELVDKYISNVYDVIMHFDDRNRVVDGLRAKGMKVAQVEPGDF